MFHFKALKQLSLAALASVVLTLGSLSGALAAQPTFTAQTACQAYVSKNKLTNPDQATLVVGTTYPVQSILNPESPT